MSGRLKKFCLAIAFTCAMVTFGVMPATATQVTLSGVPIYYWWYGCSPTSGGMLVGYYDGLPGYGNLVADTTGPYAMIHSPFDGVENSIGDFMNTNPSTGGTSDPNIAAGMKAYIEWNDPNTPINESYSATTWNEYTDDPEYIAPGWTKGEFIWADYKAEIDAGRPMLLSWGTSTAGHTTIGIGYDDFNSTNPNDWKVAIYTTWSGWPEPSWWYFDPDMSGFNPGDWNLDLGTFVRIEPQAVPEPCTLLLIGVGIGLVGLSRIYCKRL